MYGLCGKPSGYSGLFSDGAVFGLGRVRQQYMRTSRPSLPGQQVSPRGLQRQRPPQQPSRRKRQWPKSQPPSPQPQPPQPLPQPPQPLPQPPQPPWPTEPSLPTMPFFQPDPPQSP